jgi:adenylate cyclase
MKKRFRVAPACITLLIAAIGITAYLIHVPFLDVMELKTVDLRLLARGEISPGPEVVMAVIDEKSLDREGKWIWPRTKIADLIDRISRAGARVIALDICFAEPDDGREIRVLHDIDRRFDALFAHDPAAREYLYQLARDNDHDRQLAEAIHQSGSAVVLGYFFKQSEDEAAHRDESFRCRKPLIAGSMIRQTQWASDRAFEVIFPEIHIPEGNIPVLCDAASYSGFFNMEPDADGVLRWLHGMLKFGGDLYANLSLKTLSAYWQQPIMVRVGDHGVTSLMIGDHEIPTDELGRIMVNYRGPPRTFPHIPATDIIRGNVPEADLRDRIVIIGATAVGVYDLRVTPFSSVFPGVEVHANVIDMALSGDFLFYPAWAAYIDMMAIIILGGILGFLITRVRVTTGALCGLVMTIGYVYFTYSVFSRAGVVLNIVYPVSVLLLVYVIVSAYRYFMEEGEKRFIKEAFSTYISPAVVEQLIRSPENLVLGGERREITAFFSDVAGFTSISEKLSPENLVELLNEFLSEMTDIIQSHNGTVDKFEGDAIIAMFGAPVPQPDHALAACAASIDMQERLAILRKKWETEKQLTIRMRIGLCSGPAVVGNMGSKRRFDYTMMGDTVNTAARLEGVNKQYGTYVMISETTYAQVSHAMAARELDAVNVMGKAVPIRIYELIGYADQVDAAAAEVILVYTAGLEAYRKREWDAAEGLFQQVLALWPEDGPSRVMIDRCAACRENAPPDDWNGAFVLKSK